LGRPLLEGISYYSISSANACDLVKEFPEKEVFGMPLMTLVRGKPHCFNIAFFQHC